MNPHNPYAFTYGQPAGQHPMQMQNRQHIVNAMMGTPGGAAPSPWAGMSDAAAQTMNGYGQAMDEKQRLAALASGQPQQSPMGSLMGKLGGYFGGGQ